MRNSIILLFITLLSLSCSRLKYLNAFNGYKGNPKNVVSTNYLSQVSEKGDSTIEKLSFEELYSFDSKGRIVKHLFYSSDSNINKNWWKYVYDKSGNIIQNTLFRKDSSIVVTNNYQFNKYGQIIQREYLGGNDKSITQKRYDRKKREVIIYGYNKTNDSLYEKEKIYYNDKWKDKEIIGFNKSGKLNTRIENEYDDNQNNTRQNWYDSNNKMYEFYKNFFNEKNDRIRIEKYNVRKGDTTLIETSKIEYQYDLKGNVIYERFHSNKSTSSITRTKFLY
jgi:hypothetical protein